MIVYLMTMRDRHSSLGSLDLYCTGNKRYHYLFNPATSHLSSLRNTLPSLTVINRLFQCGGLNLKLIRTWALHSPIPREHLYTAFSPISPIILSLLVNSYTSEHYR